MILYASNMYLLATFCFEAIILLTGLAKLTPFLYFFQDKNKKVGVKVPGQSLPRMFPVIEYFGYVCHLPPGGY